MQKQTLVKEKESNNIRPLVLLILSGALWGTSFPAISYGLQYSSPQFLLFLRFFIASLIASVLFPKSVIKALKYPPLIITGILNGIAYLLQFIGQQWVPAGQSALLVNSYSVIVPFIAYFLIKEKITVQKIFGAIIGLTGVLLITNDQSKGIIQANTTTQYYLGVLLVFGAGLVWAFYVVYIKHLETTQFNKNNSILRFSSEDILLASMYYTVLIAVITLPFSRSSLNSSINIVSFSAALYLAIFCSVLPLIMYLHSLKTIEAGLSTIILLIEVLVSFMISTAFLGETIILRQVIGGAFIIIGVLIAMRETTK